MRIKIINPTTTDSFTRKNLEAGRAVAAAGSEIVSAAVESGPVSIEGHYDEAASVIGIPEEIVGECRRALAEDESGAIVLGCAGRADVAARISDEIGAPVVEGVSAAVKRVEGIVALGLGTSKVGDLAYPLAKPYSGSVGHLSADRHFTAKIAARHAAAE